MNRKRKWRRERQQRVKKRCVVDKNIKKAWN